MSLAKLPEWSECEAAVDEENATALQRFIYDNEPGDYDEAKKWREQLLAAIVEAGENER